MSIMRGLIEAVELGNLPVLDEVLVPGTDTRSPYRIVEGKFIDGRFKNNIRIDRPTHLGDGSGDVHAHVYGRHGDQVVVVNLDGSGSHNTKGRLSPEDASALKLRGFKVRDDRVVEWVIVQQNWQVLTEVVSG